MLIPFPIRSEHARASKDIRNWNLLNTQGYKVIEDWDLEHFNRWMQELIEAIKLRDDERGAGERIQGQDEADESLIVCWQVWN